MTSPLKLGRTTAEPPTRPQPQQPTPQPGPGPKPAGPTHPTPTGPPNRNADAQILDDIDATLVGLIAMAAFGPCEQGTTTSVEQASTAEVLLFRLKLARRGVAELREALELPARHTSNTNVVFVSRRGPSGPGSNSLLARGKELTPSSATPIAPASESTDGGANAVSAGALLPARQVPLTGARVYDDTVSVPGGLGSNHPLVLGEELVGKAAPADTTAEECCDPGPYCDDLPGCVIRAPIQDGAATFALPPIPTVPSFDNGPRFAEGEHRLYGPVASQPEPAPNPGPLPPAPIPQTVGAARHDARRPGRWDR